MKQGEKPIKRIIIAGGGTAGWMTAAAMSKVLGFQGLNIVLVESDEIGTIGVGEATIPAIRRFNRMLGLDEADFLRSCCGTYKLGIQFIDWGQRGESYVHSFAPFGSDLEGHPFYQLWLKHSLLQESAGTDPCGIDDYNIGSVAALAQRFFQQTAEERQSSAYYAFHFDASLYARYLRAYAEKRGVTRIEGKICHVFQDTESGFIESIKLENGVALEGDLFVDCTGFRGVLIEQTLRSGYESWSKWLPCNRAVAAPCRSSGPLLPYTKAIADNAGWRWRIPLQSRLGNGYVYSSEFISDNAAEERLVETLDGEILSEPRRLSFTTGIRKSLWNRNCVAIGLASGFLEPLESTSIHFIHTAIVRLFLLFPHMNFNNAEIKEYNRRTLDEYSAVRDFLILHYKVTQREDTEFWRYCRNMDVPVTVADALDLFRANGRLYEAHGNLFPVPSMVSVLIGQGGRPQSYDPQVDVVTEADLVAHLAAVKSYIASRVNDMPTHAECIKQIGAAI